MTILENGEYRDATLEELEAFEEDAARAAAAERHRPLTAEEVTRMLLAQQINSLPLDDATALRSREFYPEWAPGTEYPAEYKVQYARSIPASQAGSQKTPRPCGSTSTRRTTGANMIPSPTAGTWSSRRACITLRAAFYTGVPGAPGSQYIKPWPIWWGCTWR